MVFNWDATGSTVALARGFLVRDSGSDRIGRRHHSRHTTPTTVIVQWHSSNSQTESMLELLQHPTWRASHEKREECEWIWLSKTTAVSVPYAIEKMFKGSLCPLHNWSPQIPWRESWCVFLLEVLVVRTNRNQLRSYYRFDFISVT